MSGFDDDFLDNVVNAPVTNAVDPFDDLPKAYEPLKDELLTDEEKKRAIDAWNSGVSELKALIEAACGKGFDGRSKKGMAVKKYLAEKNMQARPAQVHAKKVDNFTLTDDNKEFIANNAAAMKPLEITRLLFDDAALTPLSAQFRVVKEYYDKLDLKVKASSEDENIKDYNPPKTEQQALARLNRYVLDSVTADKITPKQREALAKMISFMHTHRYLFEINNLPLNSERELFESSFVRFVNDKPDLTQEEIDLYLNQCSDIVAYQRMQKELVFLTDAAKTTMEVEQKVPMALVEAISRLRGNMDDNFKRQKTTLNDLNGKRKDRLEKIQANNESVLKLIEAFREEGTRKRILKLAAARKQELKDETGRLESLEDLRFQLWGASPQELI